MHGRPAILTQNGITLCIRVTKYTVCMMDIKEAFDEVWHNEFCTKLKSKVVCWKLFSWLQNYLHWGSIKVVISEQHLIHRQSAHQFPRIYSWTTSVSVFIDDLVDAPESKLYTLLIQADDFHVPIRSASESDSIAASLNRYIDRVKRGW